jgi:uncharacterized membrane protein
MNDIAPARDLAADTRLTHILYLLHGLAPFTVWVLAIAAIIIGAITRDNVAGTYLDSHYSWLSRTFWWSLLWAVICAVITVILVITIVGVLIAWLPFVILFVWYLYRVLKGWLRLNDKKPAD